MKTCRRGHEYEGRCKECLKLANGRYRERNREVLSKKARKCFLNHKETNSEYYQKWQVRNKDYQRKYRLDAKYSISIDDFNKMLEQQNNLCNICNRQFNNDVCVDHCHVTDKVRGLLCNKCNTGLGLFQESIDVLKNAAEYLARYSGI